MSAREDAKVYQHAQQFVEKVEYREDIWKIYDEVESCIRIIEETGLGRLLMDATVPDEDKEQFLRNLRQSDYRAVNDVIEKMIQDKDFSLVKVVLQTILQLISKRQNKFDVHISTYQALTDEQKQRLQQLVERRFEVKTRNIIEEIDQSLIGGFIVTVDHQVIDASVRKQLNDIRKKL